MEPENTQQLCPELRAVLDGVLAEHGLELQSHVVTSGCRPGDNYLGEVLRVEATSTSSQQRKFIFKCPPLSKKWREALVSIKFTRNETAFYTQVVPKLEKFRVEHSGENLPPLSVPKFYTAVCDTDNDVLVLEDLKVSGFVMADKMKGLDIEHCKLALQELGRFHALSLAMKALNPSEFEDIKSSITEVYFFEKGREQFSTTHYPCNAAINMVRKRFPDSNYVEKFKKLTDNFFDKMMELISTETPLGVICHGDCWTNNLLFRYSEDGRPEKVRMLDFQIARYGSLAHDVSYFIYDCTTQQTRDLYWDDMITVYLAELNDALANLGTPTSQISRSQLTAELIKFGRTGIGMATMAIPLFMTPTEKQPSLDGGLEVFDNFHQTTYKNPLCVERLTDVIADAMKRGLFDL